MILTVLSARPTAKNRLRCSPTGTRPSAIHITSDDISFLSVYSFSCPVWNKESHDITIGYRDNQDLWGKIQCRGSWNYCAGKHWCHHRLGSAGFCWDYPFFSCHKIWKLAWVSAFWPLCETSHCHVSFDFNRLSHVNMIIHLLILFIYIFVIQYLNADATLRYTSHY